MGTRSKESQESCKRLSVCCEVSQMGDIFTAGKSSEQKQVKRERKNIKATEAELEERCVCATQGCRMWQPGNRGSSEKDMNKTKQCEGVDEQRSEKEVGKTCCAPQRVLPDAVDANSHMCPVNKTQ